MAGVGPHRVRGSAIPGMAGVGPHRTGGAQCPAEHPQSRSSYLTRRGSVPTVLGDPQYPTQQGSVPTASGDPHTRHTGARSSCSGVLQVRPSIRRAGQRPGTDGVTPTVLGDQNSDPAPQRSPTPWHTVPCRHHGNARGYPLAPYGVHPFCFCLSVGRLGNTLR